MVPARWYVPSQIECGLCQSSATPLKSLPRNEIHVIHLCLFSRSRGGLSRLKGSTLAQIHLHHTEAFALFSKWSHCHRRKTIGATLRGITLLPSRTTICRTNLAMVRVLAGVLRWKRKSKIGCLQPWTPKLLY